MAKYKQHQDGDWVSPVMDGYRMKCCDCGLVHRINFRVVNGDGDVEFQAFRDNRATAAVRRGKKKRPSPARDMGRS